MMAPEKINYETSLKQLLMGFCEITSAINVTGVAIDSRKVEPGNLFIAYKGSFDNGLNYLGEAIEKGAVAIIIDDNEEFDIESFSSKIFKALFKVSLASLQSLTTILIVPIIFMVLAH